jgi:spore coat polysaccharide biosynthesis protein SpsF
MIATTTDPSDDPVEKLCNDYHLDVYRGHPTDLLDRHYKAAIHTGSSYVAKIPSDCPLIDPAVIDKTIASFFSLADHIDYISNLHPATYPDGNDVEVMHFHTLEYAWKEAVKPMEREHTTPYIWENPDRFRIANVEWESGLNYSMSHRWTIDYPEDYEFIRHVYEDLYPHNPGFSLSDILNLLNRKPEIFLINSGYAGVNWYRNHLDELKTVNSSMTKQQPNSDK